MAKPDLTSSATNSDGNASSPDVSADAGGANRRDAMNMMSAVTAGTNSSSAAALWRIVVSEYESEAAAYEIVSDEYSARMQAYDAIDFAARYAVFEQFEPICLKYRGDTILAVVAQLATKRGQNCGERGGVSAMTDAEYFGLFAEAVKIVTDYAALQAEAKDAAERIYGDIEERHDAAVDKLGDAREKLLATPAPDWAALSYKLDILCEYLNDCDSEDKERVGLIRSDVNRLLAA
jgi:hypothetical protein